MDVRHKTVGITTSTAGAFTQTFDTAGPLLLQIVYVPGSNISGGADLTVTDTQTGSVIFSDANFGATVGYTKLPRRLISNAVGAVDSTSLYDYQAVTRQTTLAVANATAAGQLGTFHLVYG
jgi:hypothetical protein